MLPRMRFGRTGHESSRLLFGAAALWAVSDAEADATLQRVLDLGINHIDTAASYGEAERHLGRWMPACRDRFFLATKTGERDYVGARDSLHRSLERMGVDRVDLLQLHNLVDEEGWQEAMSERGALRAALDARDEGLVRFLGVTGHGTRVAGMHRRSLEVHDFDSVLLPCSRTLLADPEVCSEFEALLALCQKRDVAVQTIKAIARRRWPDPDARSHATWYEPLTDPDAIEREIHWVLDRYPVFVNSAGDLSLLEASARAVERHRSGGGPSPGPYAETEALFVRGHQPASP